MLRDKLLAALCKLFEEAKNLFGGPPYMILQFLIAKGYAPFLDEC